MPDSTFEAKMGQLSDVMINDKAPGLSKDKVGFKVLEKNEDETRAVGVMAYRVGKQWLFVPCFWLGGRLKGADSIYRAQVDAFVPLTEGWISYIRSKEPTSLGHKTDVKPGGEVKGPQNVSMTRLGRWGQKSAQDLSVESLIPGFGDFSEKMKTVKQATQSEAMLEEGLKCLGHRAVTCLIDTMKFNGKFAAAVTKFHHPENLVKMMIGTLEKKAAVKEETVGVISFKDKDKLKSLTDDEKTQLLVDGVVVRDNRKNKGVVYVETNGGETLTTPDKTGVYEILMADGSFRKMLAIVPDIKTGAASVNQTFDGGRVYLVDLEDGPKNRAFSYRRPDVSGYLKSGLPLGSAEDIKELDDAGMAVTAANMTDDRSKPAGTSYRVIVDKTGRAFLIRAEIAATLSGDVIELSYMKEINTSSNLPAHSDYTKVQKGRGLQLRLTGKDGKIFRSGDIMYVPSNARMFYAMSDDCGCLDEKKPAIGSLAATTRHLAKEASESFKTLKVYSDGDGVRVNESNPTNKAAAIVRLVKEFHIPQKQASEMVNKVVSKAYHAKPVADRYLVKLAEMIEDEIGRSARGDDMFESEEVTGSRSKPLDNITAEKVIKASEMGVKDVLDVAVLNGLARNADSSEIMEDYMPALGSAMDKVGRLLFHFYWHNDNFKEKYGSQEMSNLEQSLKRVFTDLSDLLLFLREKTTSHRAMFETTKGELAGDLGQSELGTGDMLS